jgi:hypothetical protein
VKIILFWFVFFSFFYLFIFISIYFCLFLVDHIVSVPEVGCQIEDKIQSCITYNCSAILIRSRWDISGLSFISFTGFGDYQTKPIIDISTLESQTLTDLLKTLVMHIYNFIYLFIFFFFFFAFICGFISLQILLFIFVWEIQMDIKLCQEMVFISYF